MKKTMRRAIMLAAALTMMIGILAVPSNAAAKKAAIKDVDYSGKGVVDVEFQNDVKYKKAKVAVKDTKGKKYKAKVVRKDSDDIEFKIKKFKKNRTYKFTVKGVKENGTSSYGKATGKVVVPKTTLKASKRVGKAEAKNVALADAGFKASEVEFIKAEFDYDDGFAVYEIDFVKGNKEYEYEIAAKTGKILHKEVEGFGGYDDDYYDGDYDDRYDDDYYDDDYYDDDYYGDDYLDYQEYDDDGDYDAPAKASKSVKITKAEAKAAALKHAGLSAGSVTFIKAELDYDDGAAVYEVDFYKGRMEYEYDISAKTGKILSFSREYDD